MNDDITVIEKV